MKPPLAVFILIMSTVHIVQSMNTQSTAAGSIQAGSKCIQQEHVTKAQASESALAEKTTAQKNLDFAQEILNMINANCSEATIVGLQKIIYEYATSEAEWQQLKILSQKLDAGLTVAEEEKKEFKELLTRVKEHKATINETQTETLEAADATADFFLP